MTSPVLPSDLALHERYLHDSVPRLLALQDRDPLSPTRGSFDTAYWRDKTSDTPDARYQEAAALLGLLDGGEPAASAARAGVEAWIRAQYPEGCFDGWYRGERSYSATASSTLAMALLRHEKPQVIQPLLPRLDIALRRAAGWLARRHDPFRSHQGACAAAALAQIAVALGEPGWHEGARQVLDSLLAHQTGEGWFPEVGEHADPGNTWQLLDYLSLHAQLAGSWDHLAQLERALEFAACYLHPGPSTGREYGVCHDAHTGRLAIVLLAGKLPGALPLFDALDRPAPATGSSDPLAPLRDDRGLCRRGLLALLACRWHGRLRASIEDNRPALASVAPAAPTSTESSQDAPQGIVVTTHRQAGLLRVEHGPATTLVAPVAGGLVRSFARAEGGAWPGALLVEDRGYRLEVGARRSVHTTPRYDPKATFTLHRADDHVVVEMQVNMLPLRYFFPTYWARLGLRLACLTPWTARLMHRYINRFRRKAATALIEAAPPILVQGRPLVRLDRFVSLYDDGRVEVDDKLTNLTLEPIGVSGGALEPLCDGPDAWRSAAADAIAAAETLAPGVPLTTFREFPTG